MMAEIRYFSAILNVAFRSFGVYVRLSPDISRLINTIMRGTTLVSKFLLIFFLARFLQPAELGLYGLLAATISYALYPVGLEFYTYTTREIIRSDRSVWAHLLKNQMVLIGLLYVLLVPLMLLIFARGALPWNLAGWFFLLLVLEHLAQEMNRLLVAISEQLLASLILFLRMGAWALLIVPVMQVDSSARELSTVLGGWAIGAFMACLLGLHRLRGLHMGGWRIGVDWPWIRRGVMIAVPLLISSLTLRGLFTADRYWVQALTNLDVLGAYVLFMGMASALASFLDAGVFVFIYPELISAFHDQKPLAFRHSMSKLLFQTFSICAVYVFLALLLTGSLLKWLHKPVYLQYHVLFPWVLLAMVLYSIGMVPHYGLYAQHRDRSIVHSHIAGAAFFVPMTWLVSLLWPNLAVPIGLCCAFGLILVWKALAYFRLTPSPYRAFERKPSTA